MTISAGADTTSSIRQHTLARATQLHTVRHRRRTDVLTVHPAEADTGIRFVRHGSVSAAGIIPAHWDAVVDTRGGIVLGNSYGMTLHGTIPLLAALRVAGVDNAVVEIHGSRIPGESDDFDFYLDTLTGAGMQAQAAARRLLCVTDTVEARDSSGVVTLSPATGFRACINTTTNLPDGYTDMACATLQSDFTEPYAGFSAPANDTGAPRLAPCGDARASLLYTEIRGLPESLRTTVVELIGHLSLAGAPVAANIRGHSAGPRLYQTLLHAVMERNAVTLTTVDAHRARHRTTAHTIADAAIKPGSGTCLC